MQVSCPFCHVTLAIPDNLIGSGQPVQCAQCHQAFAVSPPPTAHAPVAPPPAQGYPAGGYPATPQPGYGQAPAPGGYQPLAPQQPIPGSPYDVAVPPVPSKLGLYAGIGGGVVFLAILIVAVWPRAPKPDPLQELLKVPVSSDIANTVVLNPNAKPVVDSGTSSGGLAPSDGMPENAAKLTPSAAPYIEPLVLPPVEWRGKSDLTLLEAAASRLEAQIAQANAHLAPFRAQRDELEAEVRAATNPEE
ncbi:hypothetical protein GC163_23575 [bacterium]|nr:hypothetical protein [bacterium]